MKREGIASSLTKLRYHLIVLLLCFIVTAIYAYPSAISFTSSLIGGAGDNMVLLWNMWWAKYALTEIKTNPFYTDYISTPFTLGLSLHGYVFSNNVLSIPLQGFLSLVTINNVLVYLSFMLSGLGSFLLIRLLIKDNAAALVGAVVYAFCPYNTYNLVGGMATTHWMPFYIYFLVRAMTEEKYKPHAVAASAFMTLIFYSEYSYFFLMSVLSVLVYIYFVAVKRRPFLRITAPSLLLAAITALLVSPVLFFAYSDVVSGNARAIPPSSGIGHQVIDIAGFFLPSGHLGISDLIGVGIPRNFAFLGYVPLALAIAGYSSRRDATPGRGSLLFCIILFALLSLGGVISFYGHVIDIPMPADLLSHIPILNNFRAPERFIIVIFIFFSVLAAQGAKAVLSKRRYLVLVLVPLVLIEYYPKTFNQPSFDIPPVYNKIREDGSNGMVLEVPFFVQDGFGGIGIGYHETLVYQSAHQRRIFNGYISRIPLNITFSYLNLPVIRQIILAQQNISPLAEEMAAEKETSPSFVSLFDVDYVIIHKMFPAYNRVKMLVEYLLPATRFHEDNRLVVYKIEHKTGPSSINVGTRESIPYLFRGWMNGQEDSGLPVAHSHGTRSDVILPLKPADQTVSVRAKAYYGLSGVETKVLINDVQTGTFVLGEGWNEYPLQVPEKLLKDGVSKISFLFSKGAPCDFSNKRPPKRNSLTEVMDRVRSFETAKGLQFYWEQDNSKLPDGKCSMILDSIELHPHKP